MWNVVLPALTALLSSKGGSKDSGGMSLGGLMAGSAAQFLPTLFSGAMRRADPMRAMRASLMQELDPQKWMGYANQFYGMQHGSPAYTNMRRGVATSSAALRSAMAARLGVSGLGSSGIGALAGGAGDAQYGMGVGNLNASLWEQAMNQANTLQGQRLGAITSTPFTNWGLTSAGSGLGGSLSLLNNYLEQFHKSNKPGQERL